MHGKHAQMVRPTHERAMLGSLATTRSPGVWMVWAPSLSPPRATLGASLGATSYSQNIRTRLPTEGYAQFFICGVCGSAS